MRKVLLGAMLASALSLVANTVNAQDDRGHDQSSHDGGNRTYYDAAHKDQHQWNDNENSSWNRYRQDHRVKQSDFAKTNKRQQQDYWNWRHEHSDDH